MRERRSRHPSGNSSSGPPREHSRSREEEVFYVQMSGETHVRLHRVVSFKSVAKGFLFAYWSFKPVFCESSRHPKPLHDVFCIIRQNEAL